MPKMRANYNFITLFIVSMTKLKSLAWLFVAILGLGMLSACDENNKQPEPEPQPQGDPVITLNMNEVFAAKQGERFNVEYFIENQVDGKSITITPKANWIVNTDQSLAGIFSFSVEKNKTVEQRETTIEFSYEGAETVSLVVKQEQGDAPAFTNDNVRVTITDYTMDVYPVDKRAPFIMLSASQDYADSMQDSEGNYGTDLALFEDDMAYYEWLGTMFYGKTLAAMLSEVARYGDQIDVRVGGAQPATDYILYAYHVDLNECTMVGEMSRFEVTTENVRQVEAEFNFDVYVDEASVLVSVSYANDYKGRYYFDMMPVQVVQNALKEGQSVESYFTNWWNTIVNEQISSVSYAEVLANCSNGADSYEFDLLQTTDYYLFSLAVDPNYAYAASTPQVQVVRTEEVSMSDNVIEITVTNIGSQSADLNYKTSNYDPYFAGYVPKEVWESYGSDDANRFIALMTEFEFEKLEGDIKASVLGLTQETEYVAYAFGCAGGVMTTDQIYYTEFTTSYQGAGNVTMEFEYPGYFSIYDICALDSGYNGYLSYADDYCLLPFKLTLDPEKDVESYYWDWFDETNYQHSEEELITSLMYSTAKNMLASVYILPFNAPCVFAGFATDEAGFGPLCRFEVTPVKSGVTAAEEYFEFVSRMYTVPAPTQATMAAPMMTGGVILPQVKEASVANATTEFVSKADRLFPKKEAAVPASDLVKMVR